MRKSMMVVLLGMMCVGSQAQENIEGGKLRLGSTVGMNVSRATGQDNKLGYQLGVRGEWDFRSPDKGLFLDFGVLLSEKGYKSKEFYYPAAYSDPSLAGTAQKWTLHPTYLEVPLHVGYRFSVGRNVNLFGSFGPYFGVGLFGKSKVNTTLNGVETTMTVAQNVFHHLHRFDAGLGLRAGAEFAHCYQVAIGYDWGLTHLSSASKDKNRNFSLSFGYMF